MGVSEGGDEGFRLMLGCIDGVSDATYESQISLLLPAKT